MGKAIDLTGMTFANDMITVLHRAENKKNRQSRWVCQCGCGNTFVEYGLNLKNGNRRSCGCLKKRCLARESMPEAQMKTPSNSLSRLKGASDPYQNLANAIVAVAVDDYRKALKDDDEQLIKSLERFFYSEWYEVLTNVPSDKLLSYLNRENRGYLNVVNI